MLRHQEVSFHLYLIFLMFFCQKTYPSVKRGHTPTILYLAYMVQHLFTFILSSLCSSVKKHILLSKEATPQPFFIWRIWSSIFSPLSYLPYILQSKNMSFCQKRGHAPNHSLSGVYGPVASNLRVHMAAANFPASA